MSEGRRGRDKIKIRGNGQGQGERRASKAEEEAVHTEGESYKAGSENSIKTKPGR